jgi:carboxymethylenebutenolidase
VASYGGKDRSPMGYKAAARLERALTANGVPHDIKVYPEASHGFLNDHPPGDMTPLTALLSKLSGTRYHQPSAQDARRRIVTFFDKHLKS